MMINKLEQCVICNDNLLDMGHNPYPLFDTGRCCEYCNEVYVVPARIADLNKSLIPDEKRPK